jgi:hypothetical protein
MPLSATWTHRLCVSQTCSLLSIYSQLLIDFGLKNQYTQVEAQVPADAGSP